MIIPTEKQLSCLYFPYADPKPSQSLLMAALLYDRIYFLEPDFYRPPCTRPEDSHPIGRMSQSMKSIGVFREIGPELMGFSRSFGANRAVLDKSLAREIRSSMLADLANEKLRQLTHSYGKRYWKIPNGQFLFWNGLGLLFDFIESQETKGETELWTSRPDYYSDFLASAGYSKMTRSSEEMRVRGISEELVVRVPFLVAESLMVNVSLCACTEFGLIPFTDDEVHNRFLSAKLRSLMGVIGSHTLGSTAKGISYGDLGVRSFEIGFPGITGLTPEKVKKLRGACTDELSRFRLELAKLVYSIECKPWEVGYEDELTGIIETQVRPAVIDLEAKLSSLKKKCAIDLIEKAMTTAPFPLLLNAFTGLPISLALAGSIGGVWLKQILDYRQKKSEIKRNGVSFLLNFR